MGQRISSEFATLWYVPKRSRDALLKGDRVDSDSLYQELPAFDELLKDSSFEKIVFVFTRHVGCPFAQKTISQTLALAIENPNVLFAVVSPGDNKETTCFARLAAGKSEDDDTWHAPQNVLLIGDEEYRIYDVFGVPITGWSHLLSGDMATNLMNLQQEGIINTMPTGSRWQSAAVYVLASDAREVKATHFPEHAGDMPDLKELVAA
eukprot:Clim_evm1s98 gene=Clim_evmTU1s98